MNVLRWIWGKLRRRSAVPVPATARPGDLVVATWWDADGKPHTHTFRNSGQGG